jgi:hypothetical protein
VFGVYLVAAFWLYWPALDAYFVAEDLTHVRWGAAEVAAEFGATGVTVGFRPGTAAYMAANNAVWGRWAAGHRAVALVLHALCGWFVFGITRRIVRDVPYRDVVAAGAGLLFVGAASQSEAVIWIAAAAGTVTSAAVCLAAAWLWSRDEGTPRLHTVGPHVVGLTAVLYLVAMLVKEVAVCLPGLLLAVDWGLGRGRTGAGLRGMAGRYAPLGAALGVYALLYALSGAWESSTSYGFGQLSVGTLLGNARLYAHDLWMPLSGLRAGESSPLDWVWIGTFVLFFALVPRARWALAWIVAALLPVAMAYGERLSYLAAAGMSAALAIALLAAVNETQRSLGERFGTAGDAANWVAAGELAWSIPRQAKALVPEPMAGAELYFADLPDNVGGAYALRWGIGAEVRHVYGDAPIRVFHVMEGGGGKVSPASIPCEAAVERYFFRYDAVGGALRLVEPGEIGVRC